MQLESTDLELDSLIALFNKQTSKQNWDEAYGTALAIQKVYQDRANGMEGVIINLRSGLILRAKQKARKECKS